MNLVMPDKKYRPFNNSSRVSECTPRQFRDTSNLIPDIRIIEFDTFKNGFSFNTVIEKL